MLGPYPRPGRVLITGAAGMLGSELLVQAPADQECVGTDLREGDPGNPKVLLAGLDLTDDRAVESAFEEHGPFRAVIHAAAYTAVDQAEEEEELAYRVNAVACRVLARSAGDRDIPLVVVSTDFVFDGTRSEPYREQDPPNPQGAYGRTKLAGEHGAIEMHPDGTAIVRTQWLYGPRGGHFPGTMLRLASERPELKVVHDQIGSPTSTLELAPAVWDVLLRGEAGVYHASCEGSCSWYDFAVATFELAGVDVKVEPCTTEEFPRPAPRPAYSVLDCSKLAALRGRTLSPWRDALATYLEQYG